jgi:hypothetical protein
MLLLLLLCDARRQFIVCRFHVGLHDIVEPSMHSQVCAPARRRLFAQQLHCHTCTFVCICVSYSDSSVISSLLLAVAVSLTLRLQAIRSRMLKFCLVVAGYVAMASLAYWV